MVTLIIISWLYAYNTYIKPTESELNIYCMPQVPLGKLITKAGLDSSIIMCIK